MVVELEEELEADEVDEVDELDELDGAEDELPATLVLSVEDEPPPGAPVQAAVAVRASAASPVRRTRAWRAGCSVTARTYLAVERPTKPPTCVPG